LLFYQTVDGEAQPRQNRVVNDVLEENRVRIERFFFEDYAVGKFFYFTDF